MCSNRSFGTGIRSSRTSGIPVHASKRLLKLRDRTALIHGSIRSFNCSLLEEVYVEGEDHKAETPVKEEVKEIEVQEPADTTEETNELYAPMKGEVLDVAKSADPAFASKAMGEGVAINPSEGIVYAPADGTISLIFPTKHAMGITLNSGVELLIHAGIDTVKMNGEGFETFVETGAKVKKGDKLLSFDMDLVKEKGYKTQTMFLVADAKGKEVEVVEAADADNNTKIMN